MGVTLIVQGLLNNSPVVPGCPGQQSPSECLALVLCLVPDADVRDGVAHPSWAGWGEEGSCLLPGCTGTGHIQPRALRSAGAATSPGFYLLLPTSTLPSHGVITPAWGSLRIQESQLMAACGRALGLNSYWGDGAVTQVPYAKLCHMLVSRVCGSMQSLGIETWNCATISSGCLEKSAVSQLATSCYFKK